MMLLLMEKKFSFWLTVVYIQVYSVLFNYRPSGFHFMPFHQQFNDIIVYIADKLDSVRDHFESCMW